MNWLFNTELRRLALQQCYNVMIADATWGILLIRELEIDNDNELVLSAINIGIKAKDQDRGFRLKKVLRRSYEFGAPMAIPHMVRLIASVSTQR